METDLDTHNMQKRGDPAHSICKWRWSYPVVHISRGEIRTCDKPVNVTVTEKDLQTYGTDAFTNHPYLMERRKEKLQGIRHSDCFTCIKLEARGIQSTRIGGDRFLRYMNDVVGISGTLEEFSAHIDARLLRADHPDILEISLSNLCNLKCIYCSPMFSTSWEEEEIRFGGMMPEQLERVAKPAPPSFETYFWEWFAKITNSLDRIIFIGGEPTINPRFLSFLTRIEQIMRDSKQVKEGRKITINIISNFNAPRAKFDQFLEIASELSNRFRLHIEASGEAFGKKSEYIRHGLDWELYVENIKRLLALRNPNIRFGFQMAINSLCISSLLDLLKMADQLQKEFAMPVDYKENIVVQPEYLAPYSLTPDFASYVHSCHEFVACHLANETRNKLLHWESETSASRWARYLPFLSSIEHGITSAKEAPVLRRQFANFVDRNDKRRGSDFLSVFPEYGAFLDLCRR
jgi:organic radical activating enzyme